MHTGFPPMLQMGGTYTGVLLSRQGLVVCPFDAVGDHVSVNLQKGGSIQVQANSEISLSSFPMQVVTDVRALEETTILQLPRSARDAIRQEMTRGAAFASVTLDSIQSAQFIGALVLPFGGPGEKVELAFLRLQADDIDRAMQLEWPENQVPASLSADGGQTFYMAGLLESQPLAMPADALSLRRRIVQREQALLLEVLQVLSKRETAWAIRADVEKERALLEERENELTAQLAQRQIHESALLDSLTYHREPLITDSLAVLYTDLEPLLVCARAYARLAAYSELIPLASTLRLFLEQQKNFPEAISASRQEKLISYLYGLSGHSTDAEAFALFLKGYVSQLPARMLPDRLADELDLNRKDYALMTRKWFNASLLTRPGEIADRLEVDFREGLETVSQDFLFRLLDELDSVQHDALEPEKRDLELAMEEKLLDYSRSLQRWVPEAGASLDREGLAGLVPVRFQKESPGTIMLPPSEIAIQPGGAIVDGRGVVHGILLPRPNAECVARGPDMRSCPLLGIDLERIMELLREPAWGKDLAGEIQKR